MKVLIVYYSMYGNVYKMARLVAEGVRQFPGAETVLRTVPELIPSSVMDSREDMKAGRELQKDVPMVKADDFREAGAIAFGTPTRFGNVAAQLKNQIDQLTSLWLKGELEGKPALAELVRSGRSHLSGTSQAVGRLRRNRVEPALLQAGKEPVQQPLVRTHRFLLRK